MKYTLLLLLVFACNSKKMPDKKIQAELNVHPDVITKNLKCIGMNEKVLRTSYTIDNQAIDQKEAAKFMTDEKLAVDLMQGLDLNLLMVEENLDVIEFYNKNCEDYSDGRPLFQICDYKFNMLEYMRGLLYGLNHYPWKPETKKLAKETLLKYITFMANKRSDLVDKTIATTILKYMVETNVLSEKLLNEALTIDEYSLEAAESFKMRRKGKFTCNEIRESFKIEMTSAELIGQRLNNLLKKI